MEEPFAHLHVHSHYSMMRGVSSVHELCRTAAAAGFRHLALTDTNGFYGLVNFLEAARRHGIHPLVGVTLHTKSESVVVLAKTARGYELLCELITRRHLERDFSPVRELSQMGDGRSGGRSHGRFGLLRNAEAGMGKGAEDLAVLSGEAPLLETLKGRLECWVEVCPGPSSRSRLRMAAQLGLPPVATNAVHFAHSEDYPLHRLVRAIDCNRTLSTLPPEEVVPPDRWLKSAEQMAVHFPNAPEALANAARLARQCHSDWSLFGKTIFPDYGNERGDPFALLLDRCRKGILWRYGETSEAIEKRLQEELDLIRSKGFVDYFLVVADIVSRRRIHCGRGSGAASLVSYVLGITHVDPIRHNLLFGRFLNPHRKDPPDIDVDFPWDERDEMLQEILAHYGPERLASVCNHVGFGARAAVREVAKVFGIPAADIKEMTRRLSHWTHPDRIRERMERHPKFQGFSMDPPWPEIIQLAARLESLPRHLSVHCGGVVIVPDRLARYVPVQRSAKGVQVIQWEKDQSETAGLVKIDLLGNRSLAVIRDALAAVRQNTGKAPDYATFNPLDDPATRDILARGDTMGVFYVESPAMRQLQRKTRRGDFEHLVIHSSIIRPAANRYIQEYVRRLHGAPYEPIHPRLEKLLAETYGIMVYQEDVVRVSMALAGFSWAEADGLRKLLSKKSPEQLSSYRQRFHQGCARRGITPDVEGSVWDMFISFAGYSFCKPHSASYALVSFKSAYLKAHHPAEFMAAVISNGGGYYSTFAYISEARRMGLTVLGPDANASEWPYTGRAKTLRMGLQQLQAIRRETLDRLLEERRHNGPFQSLKDFLMRVEITSADAAVLVKSGALDSLAERLNRPQLLWAMEAWLNVRGRGCGWGGAGMGERGNGEKLKRQNQNFGKGRYEDSSAPSAPPLPDFTPMQRWQHEMDTLGFVLSVHPLTMAEPAIAALPYRPVPAAELHRHVGRSVRVLGWPITRKEVITREGKPMEFVSFEDTTALYEAVFFPEAFRRFCRELDVDRPYVLYGQVQCELDTLTLTVKQLHRLSLRGVGQTV